MEKSTYFIIGLIIALVLVTASFSYVLYPKNIDFYPKQDKIVYLQDKCDNSCDAYSLMPSGDNAHSEDNAMIARVFGTIYEDSDNATILGTCSDSSSKPLSSTAKVTIYRPDTSELVSQQSMQLINTGRFNYSTVVPTSRGNYLVMLNCSDGSDWAVAYTEFQNPPWANKIQQLLTNVISLQSSQYNNNVKDFEIDNLAAVSPIYPNETIYIQATFSDENGTITTPTNVNLTLLYPNRTTFLSVNQNEMMNQNGVWNYSILLSNSPRTGMYSVVMVANNSLKQAIKTTQFRIATGGPYSLRITCVQSLLEAGGTLSCTVSIVDEGEVPTESINTIWIDLDGDSEIDADEPQTQFSKETTPYSTVNEPVSIITQTSTPSGFFQVRVKTEYVGSPQPPSYASTGLTILGQTSYGGGIASGQPNSSTNACLLLTIQFKDCYYYNPSLNECVKGCPQGYSCQNYLCGVDAFSKMSLWQWILNLFSTKSNLNPFEFIETAKEESIGKAIDELTLNEKVVSILWILILFGLLLMLVLYLKVNIAIFAPPYIIIIGVYWSIVGFLWFYGLVK